MAQFDLLLGILHSRIKNVDAMFWFCKYFKQNFLVIFVIDTMFLLFVI